MTARKRKLIIYTAIVVIFVLLEIFFCLSDSRNTKVSDTFHNLTARILREELMRDSLSLHYSFADAGVYGMDETAARFRFDPLPGQDEEASSLHTYLEALSSIHPDSLSETDTYHTVSVHDKSKYSKCRHTFCPDIPHQYIIKCKHGNRTCHLTYELG